MEFIAVIASVDEEMADVCVCVCVCVSVCVCVCVNKNNNKRQETTTNNNKQQHRHLLSSLLVRVVLRVAIEHCSTALSFRTFAFWLFENCACL
jgi:hypothetical protein